MPKVIVINEQDELLHEEQVSATWQLPNKSDVIVIDNVCYGIINIYHGLKEKNITIYVAEDV